MATEIPGTAACTTCGSIAVCVNCNAGRAREADGIVRRLAITDPVVMGDYPHDYECGLCGATADRTSECERPDPYPHTADCLLAAAIAYVAGGR